MECPCCGLEFCWVCLESFEDMDCECTEEEETDTESETEEEEDQQERLVVETASDVPRNYDQVEDTTYSSVQDRIRFWEGRS